MRVISGVFKGRKLKPPPPGFMGIRPTRDQVRQAMFNVLEAQGLSWSGTSGLDLYAGTGALGIEAASRGASSVGFVDRQDLALALIAENLTSLKLGPSDAYKIIAKPVGQAIEDPCISRYLPLDWIFLDPPFMTGPEIANDVASVMQSLFAKAQKTGFFKSGAWICMEVEDKDEAFVKGLLDEEKMTMTRLFKIKQFGRSSVFFWQVGPHV